MRNANLFVLVFVAASSAYCQPDTPSDVGCPPNTLLVGDVCRTTCEFASECLPSEACINGACVPQSHLLDAGSSDVIQAPDSGNRADSGRDGGMTPDSGNADGSIPPRDSGVRDSNVPDDADVPPDTGTIEPSDGGIHPDGEVEPEDGGEPLDSGVVPDSGRVRFDGGVSRDAEPLEDATPLGDAEAEPDGGVTPDSGPRDTGVVTDSGVDAGIQADAATPADSGTLDAAPVDTGVADAGSPADSGSVDTGVVDSGEADAGEPDSGTPDASCPLTDQVEVLLNATVPTPVYPIDYSGAQIVCFTITSCVDDTVGGTTLELTSAVYVGWSGFISPAGNRNLQNIMVIDDANQVVCPPVDLDGNTDGSLEDRLQFPVLACNGFSVTAMVPTDLCVLTDITIGASAGTGIDNEYEISIIGVAIEDAFGNMQSVSILGPPSQMFRAYQP